MKSQNIKYVAYGGGVNSTAMIIGMLQHKIPPDLIVFADTGGERPDTYEYIEYFNKWLQQYNLEIQTIKKDGETLEQECIRINGLPSLAYGYKRCSLKFKRDPQNKYRNNHPQCKAVLKSGNKIDVYIGIDAGEAHRANNAPIDDKKYNYHHPLIDWDLGRDECIELIKSVGLKVPKKSSCFYCPSMRPTEIRELKNNHPELLDRALFMENNAKDNLKSVKGLGRNWSWNTFINQQDIEYLHVAEIPCACFDG